MMYSTDIMVDRFNCKPHKSCPKYWLIISKPAWTNVHDSLDGRDTHAQHSKMFANVCTLWYGYCVLCVLGANANIKAKDKKSPLQVAEEALAKESDPEEKQSIQKVREDAHHTLWYYQFHCTITHFDISNGSSQKSCTFLVIKC